MDHSICFACNGGFLSSSWENMLSCIPEPIGSALSVSGFIERISIPSATGEAKERERAANGYQRVRSRDSTILTYACLPFFRNTRNSDKRFANKAPSFSFFLIVEERRSKAKTREENRGRESVRSNETIRIPAAEDGRPFPSARIYTHTYIYIDGDEPFTRTTKPRLRSHRT